MSDTYVTPPEQGEQLPLFLTAREIQQRWQVLDGDRHYVRLANGRRRRRSDREVWAAKLREAHWLEPSIINDGVKRPVSLSWHIGSLGKPEVAGGHHRLAVMAKHRPDDLIPVLFWPDFWEAVRSSEIHYT